MLRTILALVCLISLTACGLKGPLTLPQDNAPAAVQTARTPAP